MISKENNTLIIDATNSSLGRLASFAAKQSLLGKNIIITNCNHTLISGRKASILEKYKKARARGGSALKGPNFPRSPEKIVKRTIRGMLSYKKGTGSTALKRILCYNTTPKEYENSEKKTLKKTFITNTIQLKTISKIV